MSKKHSNTSEVVKLIVEKSICNINITRRGQQMILNVSELDPH